MTTTKHEVDEIVFGAVFSIILVIGSIIIVTQSIQYGFSYYETSAFIQTLFLFSWWMLLIYVAISTKKLHAVTIHRERSQSITTLFVPNGVDMHEAIPFLSISDMIGLRGSNIEKISSAILYTVSGLGISCFMSKLFEQIVSQSAFHSESIIEPLSNEPLLFEPQWIDNISSLEIAICAPIGCWLLLTWGVHTDSNIKYYTHFIGAGIYVLSSVWSFGIQREWDTLSIGLARTAQIFSALFVTLRILHASNCLSCFSIYYQSILLLGSELVTLMMCNVCNVLFLYFL